MMDTLNLLHVTDRYSTSCVVQAMVNTGRYVPSGDWVIPYAGQGMARWRSYSLWKSMLRPEDVTDQDIGDIFFQHDSENPISSSNTRYGKRARYYDTPIPQELLADAVETVLDRRITPDMLNPRQQRTKGFQGEYIPLHGSDIASDGSKNASDDAESMVGSDREGS